MVRRRINNAVRKDESTLHRPMSILAFVVDSVAARSFRTAVENTARIYRSCTNLRVTMAGTVAQRYCEVQRGSWPPQAT